MTLSVLTVVRRITRIVLAAALLLVIFLLVRNYQPATDDRFETGSVDLTAWKPVLYELTAGSQDCAKWTLSDDRQSVTQTVNADPSIYLSDRILGNTRIEGSWQVVAHNDDDLIGFVFAYHNPGQFYLFDWKGGRQDDALGLCEQGMSVKRVNVAYSGPAQGNLNSDVPSDGRELWPTKSPVAAVQLLDHTPTDAWKYDHPYRFQLDFRPGAFRIVVRDGQRVLYDEAFTDTTYSGGQFGFYNYSQGGVRYEGFTTTVIPGESGCSALTCVLLILLTVMIVIVGIVEIWIYRVRTTNALQ